jgi:hypothetical protein
MNPREEFNAEDRFEARITAALERRDGVPVPPDFSVRVAAALPPRTAPRPAHHVGRTVAMVLVALSLVSMMLIAPHSTASYTNLPFDAEVLLMAELAAIAGWLGLNWREV